MKTLVKVKLIGRLLAVLVSVVVASGQNKSDPGGWHGTRWGMAEAEVRGIFQDKLRLCSGWPPPLNPPILLTLKGVDCFVVDDQQVGNHRYAVTFFFFESVGVALEESLRTAEQFQRQRMEFQKLVKSAAVLGIEPPPEEPKRPAIIKPGKKLALIAFFVQSVDDQVGVFHDLHDDLVNSYG